MFQEKNLEKCGKVSKNNLYSQITGAFQLSVNTLQGLRKDRDMKIQYLIIFKINILLINILLLYSKSYYFNYLSDWGMGLSQVTTQQELVVDEDV